MPSPQWFRGSTFFKSICLTVLIYCFILIPNYKLQALLDVFSKEIIKLKTKNIGTLVYQLFFFILIFEGYSRGIFAQENKEKILDSIDVVQEVKSLEKDMDSARINQADVLSPRNFKQANSYFEEAKKNLDKQSDLNKEIFRQITIARQYLNSANATANLSHKQIEDILNTRKLAVEAGAPIFYGAEFEKADEQLQKLTSELESNNAQNGKPDYSSLQTSYSNLELRAIKHKNLAQARITLVQAIDDGARIYAPEKFKMAMKNFKDTAVYIEEHRHDVAQIESRSRALNETAADLLHTTHDIAAAKKIPSQEMTAMNMGVEDVISTKQSSVAREQQKKQETINDKFERARRKFTTNEAEVERIGNTLIIRLKGLKFPTSKAVLTDSNLRLLGKVQRVVKDFSNSKVEVEGHTDSVGSEASNSKLSKERAQTVKDYLLSTDAVPASRIKVIGRGEEVPISSNKTSEGRAENRRADIIIKL